MGESSVLKGREGSPVRQFTVIYVFRFFVGQQLQ